MDPSVMSVVRRGKCWGVSIDGEVLALAQTKRAATELANDAARILRESGAQVEMVPGEKRSFKDD
jgi:Asp/Glu/hydantoin racemase